MSHFFLRQNDVDFVPIREASLIQADGQFSVSHKCCLASVLFMMSHPIDIHDWSIAYDPLYKWPSVISTILILSVPCSYCYRKRFDLLLSVQFSAAKKQRNSCLHERKNVYKKNVCNLRLMLNCKKKYTNVSVLQH